MIDIETIKVSLPLKHRFVVSGGSADIKTNLIVILNNRYSGEAAASVYYGPGIDRIEADIKKGISYLKRRKKLDLSVLNAINNYAIDPIARSALIAMALNFLSGETGKYPWEILSLGAPVGIRNSFTFSIDDPEKVVEAIKASDHPIVKIKMGSEFDAELLTKLQEVKGREIRVDANAGWTPEQAEEMIFHLDRMDVKVIEQPTKSEHIADWPKIKGKAESVELFVDEGLNTLDDYERFSDYCDGINIKMVKCGGIIAAVAIAKRAREEKKKVMLGCMVESSVGIAQSVYMSSMADYHDLDSPQLLEQDLAQGIVYDRDTIQVDREIIGGPSLKRDIIEKYIRE